MNPILAPTKSPGPAPRPESIFGSGTAAPVPLHMPSVGADLLHAVAPRFSGTRAARQRAILDAVDAVLAPTLCAYRIDTALRVAHFVAQICHESAGFRTTEEFASGAAYEGRADLGNTQPGDGRRFKGRGLIQLTGRANYRRYGQKLGLDLVAHPEAAAEPCLSLRIACEYWQGRRINRAADRDDLLAVTRLVNGGRNGLADRRERLRRAKAWLAARWGAFQPIPGQPVLARGASGEAVRRLQERLRRQGLALEVDGAFGPATERALREWQRRAGLAIDGIAGRKTWASLPAA